MSYHEISQRLDSFRLPHVIQRYGVPIPQDDQYRRHDQAVYSMWMHFVTYCSLDNESEGDVVTCIPQSPRQPPDKVDSKALFLDEASQVNPFVRTSRLSVFKTMALSLSAGVPSSSRSLTLTPSKSKHGSASPQSVTALSTPPHHRVNETNLFSKCSLRYQEYEREQAHMRLEIESERERERMHQNELLHRHRASEQRSDYGMLGSSQLSHFRGYSSVDNGVRHVPAQFPMVRMGASNQVQRQGQGQGHGPSLDPEEDFTTGSFSGLSPHAGIYNPYSTQNFQDVDYNTSYECSPSVSLSASRHCGNSGDTSPTSVSNRLSPISAHERSSFRHIECGPLEFSGESENNYLSLSAPSQYDSVTHSLLPPSSCHSSFHTRDNSCHDRTDTRYSDLHMFLSESSMLDEGQDEMDGPAFSTYDFLDQNGEEGSSPYVPSCLFRPIS